MYVRNPDMARRIWQSEQHETSLPKGIGYPMKLLRRIGLALGVTATATVLAVAAGTADAAPVSGANPTAVTTAMPGKLTTSLTNATFLPYSGGDTLKVANRSGKIIEQVPMIFPISGVDVPVRVQMSADRTSATLVPVITPQTRAAIFTDAKPYASKAQAYQRMMRELMIGWNNGGSLTAAIGAIIGLVLGCATIIGCLWVAGVGAVIGGAIGINMANPRAFHAVLNWLNA